MIVVCNGGYRTGSTLVYNIARRLLGMHLEHGLLDTPAAVEKRIGRGNPGVWKCHVWDATDDTPERVVVLHTVRNPYDVAASHLRIRDIEWGEVLEEVWLQERRANAHRDLPHVHVLSYESWYRQQRGLVYRVAVALNKWPSPETVDAIMREVGIEAVKRRADEIDPGQQDEDLWQGQHVGPQMGEPGYWRGVLTARQVDQIGRGRYF